MERKKPISHIVAGLLIAGIVILFSVLMTVLGGGGDPKGGSLTYLIIIAGLVLSVRQFGKANDYKLSFGQLFSYGFKATTMIILLFVIFLIVLSYVQPDIKEKMMEATQLEFEKQKNLTDTEIDKMMEMTNKYFWIILIGTSMVFLALVGVIGSLIGAAITKKQPKNPFEQTSY